jgi:alpha-glucosidase
VRPDELHQAFAFAFLTAAWDADVWRSAATDLLDHARGGRPVTWVVENHDVVRTPTRYGGADRARAALLTVLALPGAAYLYQGQELGLPEAPVPAAARRDPAWARTGISRDGCRVPLPWRADRAGAHGFSPPGAAPPWLPVPDGWGRYAVENQEDDPGSVLRLCRSAVALRRRLLADGVLGADDPVDWAVDHDHRLVARRPSGFTLVVAMGAGPVPPPRGTLLLSSGPLTPGGLLPPDTAAWVHSGPGTGRPAGGG